jgi:5-methylcytosine-specific restriction protein A
MLGPGRGRSRQLVLDKRRLSKRIHGRIFCEGCGLVPRSGLGEAAEACFEAHHLTRLSEASSPVATRLDDVALLCANCHRIIHRLDPVLSQNSIAFLDQRFPVLGPPCSTPPDRRSSVLWDAWH